MTTDQQERDLAAEYAEQLGWNKTPEQRAADFQRVTAGAVRVTRYRAGVAFDPATLRDHLPAIARTFGISIVDASIAAEHHLIRGAE